MKKKITQKYYDARYDTVFKNTLCTEEGKVILKPILEEILEIKIDRITFLNGALVKDNIGVKGKVVDLLLEVDGKIINVEVR